MWLLVDVENVRDAGFSGVEWLTPEDGLVIFYSTCCEKIQRSIMETVEMTGCYVDAVKLERTGKNALDFYIASYIAELASGSSCDEIAVISKDRGFQAVLDYWKWRKPWLKIHFTTNIMYALFEEYKPSARKDDVHKAMERIPFQSSALRIKRRNWLRQELSIRLDPEINFDIWVLVDSLMECTPGRQTYLSLMHQYGIENGLIIYQAVKALNNIGELQAG